MRCGKRYALVLIAVLLGTSFAQSSKNHILVYKKKYIMGTVFEVAAYDQSPEHTSDAIEKAFQEIVRLDNLLSNYKPESALSKLNRSAHFHEEEVPPDLYRVIEQAVKFSGLSNGKFDITVAPLVNLWKAALRGESEPSQAQQEEVRSCVGYQKIQLISPNRISFLSPCMQLDLGGIGKGYAVDRAADLLRSLGIHNALINAGGSTILAMGSHPDQKAWLLHLRDPSKKIDPQVMLKDESVSTSEQSPHSLLEHDGPGHIIDPDTGIPLKTNFAVSAVSKTATESDALSTSLLLMGPVDGRTLIKSMENVSAVWVSREGQVETVSRGAEILFGKQPVNLSVTQSR
jgi:thiamine biosynthesis lipoprotein